MGWSLGYLKPREPELLGGLFMSAGRALHLANSFESKCKYLLRIGNLVEAFEADPVLALQDAITTLPADKMLGPTLRDLGNRLSHARSWDIDVLDKAREARNFIAHEGANVGDICYADARRILAQVSRLRDAVTDLAQGDNIVSLWVFGTDEPREPAPTHLIDAYPEMVDKWVFGHFGELLDAGELPEQGATSWAEQGSAAPDGQA
ncbi:hypothetical protein [Streptomyces sp. NRRL B-24484]|uniref:hypothetical protein n=1 Tax=Streptomyces sp. NRRL B-24484 TaxID=1463833 RepID=UPI000D13B01C|nr:hypothetical protein [Streptomyces sp. NRRL B-24484]